MSKDPTTPSRGPGDVKRIANRDIDELARFVRDGNFSYRVFAADPVEARAVRTPPQEWAAYPAESRAMEKERTMPLPPSPARARSDSATAKPVSYPEPGPIPLVDVNVPRGQLPHITFTAASAPTASVAKAVSSPAPEAAPAPRAPHPPAVSSPSMPRVHDVLWCKSAPAPKPVTKPLLAGTVFAGTGTGDVRGYSESIPPARATPTRTEALGVRSVDQVLGTLMRPAPSPVTPSAQGSAGAVVQALFDYARVV